MTWHAYALSLGAGLLVGGLYAAVNVRSPAPPIIALLGLLGMLIGEATISYLRGHPQVLGWICHSKTFHAGVGQPIPSASTAMNRATTETKS
jgi:XapX domain-containing protein